jgi:hypothetical protein
MAKKAILIATLSVLATLAAGLAPAGAADAFHLVRVTEVVNGTPRRGQSS